MRRRLLALSLVWLVLAPSALATGTDEERVAVELDPAATRIAFLLDAVAHEVRGSATLVRGRFSFQPESGRVEGRLVVDATSLETGHRKRDRDMHRKVLESERFPEIVFLPERLDGAFVRGGASELTLHGVMEIHGSRHPLSLAAEVVNDGAALTIDARCVIPYVAWGMKDPSFFLFRVGKEVEVTIEAAGSSTPATHEEGEDAGVPAPTDDADAPGRSSGERL